MRGTVYTETVVHSAPEAFVKTRHTRSPSSFRKTANG